MGRELSRRDAGCGFKVGCSVEVRHSTYDLTVVGVSRFTTKLEIVGSKITIIFLTDSL